MQYNAKLSKNSNSTFQHEVNMFGFKKKENNISLLKEKG